MPTNSLPQFRSKIATAALAATDLKAFLRLGFLMGRLGSKDSFAITGKTLNRFHLCLSAIIGCWRPSNVCISIQTLHSAVAHNMHAFLFLRSFKASSISTIFKVFNWVFAWWWVVYCALEFSDHPWPIICQPCFYSPTRLKTSQWSNLTKVRDP